jgi:hypothetical protein
MARAPNTDVNGFAFPDALVEAVWQAALAVPELSGSARDVCGARIWRNAYGQTTQHGWEIDHIQPVALGGTDDLANLQPLHWENNRYKSDSSPWSPTALSCKRMR